MTQRVASLFALSGWAGFSGFSALRCVHEAGLSELLLGSFGANLLARADVMPLDVPQQQLLGLSAILLALAVAFAASIAGVVTLLKSDDRFAETLAAASLAALFGFYAALALSGSPAIALFGAGPLATLFIALGFAALLFDHLIAEQDDTEGDAAFEAVMLHLEEAKRAAIAKRERGDRRETEDDRG